MGQRPTKKQFDKQTTRCVVKAWLEMGTDPWEVYDELKDSPVIDKSALKDQIEQISGVRIAERHSKGLSRGTLYQFMRDTELKIG